MAALDGLERGIDGTVDRAIAVLVGHGVRQAIIAEALGLSHGAVRLRVHRMKVRHGARVAPAAGAVPVREKAA